MKFLVNLLLMLVSSSVLGKDLYVRVLLYSILPIEKLKSMIRFEILCERVCKSRGHMELFNGMS